MPKTNEATILRVSVPVPLPVHETHCYIIEAPGGRVIVDTGMDTPEARTVWQDALATMPLRDGRTRMIFVTHCHPDHLGLADWLSQAVDAPVAMMSGDVDTALRYVARGEGAANRIRTFYRAHGVPSTLIDAWERVDGAFAQMLTVPPNIQRLSDGDHCDLGGVTLRFIEVGGHTDHQGLVYVSEANVLFTGDQILSRITPNVSLWPDGHPNPLAAYLASLDSLARLDHPEGKPAHESPLGDVNRRITELVNHHQRRTQDLLELMITGPSTAYSLTPRLFSRRTLDDYQLRFALGETLAHLEYLRQAGRLATSTHGGEILYGRTGS